MRRSEKNDIVNAITGFVTITSHFVEAHIVRHVVMHTMRHYATTGIVNTARMQKSVDKLKCPVIIGDRGIGYKTYRKRKWR